MTRLRFFDFELDPATGELRRRGHTVALERQPAIALSCLATHAGRLVTRDELRRAIWPDGVHVDFDRGMNYRILAAPCAALGDEARQPVFIETIPRQGYRFVAPLQRHAMAPRSPARHQARDGCASHGPRCHGGGIGDAVGRQDRGSRDEGASPRCRCCSGARRPRLPFLTWRVPHPSSPPPHTGFRGLPSCVRGVTA